MVCSVEVPGLFSTGVDKNSSRMSSGMVDLHWDVVESNVFGWLNCTTSNPCEAFVLTRHPWYWDDVGSTTRWIGPSPLLKELDPGFWKFRTKISFTGNYNLSTVLIEGMCAGASFKSALCCLVF